MLQTLGGPGVVPSSSALRIRAAGAQGTGPGRGTRWCWPPRNPPVSGKNREAAGCAAANSKRRRRRGWTVLAPWAGLGPGRGPLGAGPAWAGAGHPAGTGVIASGEPAGRERARAPPRPRVRPRSSETGPTRTGVRGSPGKANLGTLRTRGRPAAARTGGQVPLRSRFFRGVPTGPGPWPAWPAGQGRYPGSDEMGDRPLPRRTPANIAACSPSSAKRALTPSRRRWRLPASPAEPCSGTFLPARLQPTSPAQTTRRSPSPRITGYVQPQPAGSQTSPGTRTDRKQAVPLSRPSPPSPPLLGRLVPTTASTSPTIQSNRVRAPAAQQRLVRTSPLFPGSAAVPPVLPPDVPAFPRSR